MLPLFCKDGRAAPRDPFSPHQHGHMVVVAPGCSPMSVHPVPSRALLGAPHLPCKRQPAWPPRLHPFPERSTVNAKAQWSRRLLKLIMAF